jgi:hypothetical protein
MTVRQVFYQATVHGLVPKTEQGYAMVKTNLTIMRRAGVLRYDWLADNTRWQRKPRTFDGIEAALEATAQFYRNDLWAHADCYCEVSIKKDALAGVILPVTARYDVPLMVARGYASLSFLHTAASYIGDLAHLGRFAVSTLLISGLIGCGTRGSSSSPLLSRCSGSSPLRRSLCSRAMPAVSEHANTTLFLTSALSRFCSSHFAQKSAGMPNVSA